VAIFFKNISLPDPKKHLSQASSKSHAAAFRLDSPQSAANKISSRRVKIHESARFIDPSQRRG
jgi:hypothetical protein